MMRLQHQIEAVLKTIVSAKAAHGRAPGNPFCAPMAVNEVYGTNQGGTGEIGTSSSVPGAA
jgi:hypothetical protein